MHSSLQLRFPVLLWFPCAGTSDGGKTCLKSFLGNSQCAVQKAGCVITPTFWDIRDMPRGQVRGMHLSSHHLEIQHLFSWGNCFGKVLTCVWLTDPTIFELDFMHILRNIPLHYFFSMYFRNICSAVCTHGCFPWRILHLGHRRRLRFRLWHVKP